MTSREFHLGVDVTCEGTIVRVAGELDLATAPALRDCLAQLEGLVIVDLAAVTFLDSSAMGILVAGRKHLEARGGDLRLRAPQRQVRRVLELTGLGVLVDPD